MEEALAMTAMFLVGAGTGALISYGHDRRLLSLYGDLVEDLSRMIPHHLPDAAPPPAAAARVTDLPPIVEVHHKEAS